MSQLMITGVIDGPLPGGLPKAIQLIALSDILDLSAYSLDAATSDDESFTFPEVQVSEGTVIYVSAEDEGFAEYFGFAPDYTAASFDIDANGAIELFENGTVVDVFAALNVDMPDRLLSGVQEVAFRAKEAEPSPTFDLSEWVFSGTAASEGSAAEGTSSEPPAAAAFDGTLVINEYRFTATADFRFTSNFVELLTETGASLEGLTLLVINGEAPNGSDDNIGQITWAVDLSDATADQNGFVLIGNDALTTFEDGDVVVEGFDPNGNAQTILVVRDFTGAAGDDLDTNDDGTFDVSPFGDVVAGLALRDEDRDRDVVYADDVVQADPLDPGFISAGAARQPDGDGAFVTLPYDTAAEDTPGFANVPEVAPVFSIQTGTTEADRLTGVDDQRNLIVGKEGDDLLFGGADADVIIDGFGNDRSIGRDGDDILFIQGGGKDRAVGGEGADVFKLSAAYTSSGARDILTITDFDTGEDTLDLTGALIASASVKNGNMRLTLVGESDLVVLRGVTEFDDITFSSNALPLTDALFDQIDEVEGEASTATSLSLNTRDDGFTLRGSIGDDVFEFFGGDRATTNGNGGADTFILNASMQDDGRTDKIRINGFDADDLVDITGFEINRVKEGDNRVQIFIGPDNDQIEFRGISSFDEIAFVTDTLLG